MERPLSLLNFGQPNSFNAHSASEKRNAMNGKGQSVRAKIVRAMRSMRLFNSSASVSP